MDEIIRQIKKLTQENSKLIKYHKLNGLIPSTPEEFIKLKSKMHFKNCQAFQLLSQFNKESIPYIILKGLTNAYTIYDNYWERLFADVDLLIPENFLSKVDYILKNNGYIQGYLNDNNSSIIPATRSEIIHKRLFTHELFQYCKFANNEFIKIDINFKFSWLGTNNETKTILSNNINDNVSSFNFNNEHYTCLSTIYNFIHQCIHIYNEAVFFVFSEYEPYTDTEELKLFRFIDIIKFLKILDFDQIFVMANKYNFIKELSFVIKICDILFPNFINAYIKDKLDLNNVDVNFYFTKDSEIKYWNISIMDRMFNLEKKMKSIEKMKF